MHKNILKSEVELDKITGTECIRAKMRKIFNRIELYYSL